MSDRTVQVEHGRYSGYVVVFEGGGILSGLNHELPDSGEQQGAEWKQFRAKVEAEKAKARGES